MALRKIIKEKDKIVEKYFIEVPFMEPCKVPEGYKDIVDAVSLKLKDYCIFNEIKRPVSSMDVILGGPIPDHLWQARIRTEDDYKIDIVISQSYEQPMRYLSGAKAEMKYASKISEKDLDIIRESFTSSGLEKIN